MASVRIFEVEGSFKEIAAVRTNSEGNLKNRLRMREFHFFNLKKRKHFLVCSIWIPILSFFSIIQ